MKIIALLKHVPDEEARIRVIDGSVDLTDVGFSIDGMDEYGVEEALRLREGGVDAEIVALALGPQSFEDSLRTALALGADRAIHIETDRRLDPIGQSAVLARVVRDEAADLIFVGGKQADWDSSALGPALAEALGWPHSDWTTSFELDGDRARVTHDSDDGAETLTLPLPAVITTQQGLNEPRYPTLPNIMKSKRKQLAKIALADFGDIAARTTVIDERVQTRERRRRILDGAAEESAAELARLLRDEAKVL